MGLLCVCMCYYVVLCCMVFHFISASLPIPVNASSASAPIRAPLRLTWKQLYRQLRRTPGQSQHPPHRPKLPQRGAARVEEDQDRLAGLVYSTAPGVLILHPSTPAIPPSDHRQLAS